VSARYDLREAFLILRAFVSLGSSKYSFTRIMTVVEHLVGLGFCVEVQTGYTVLEPVKNIPRSRFSSFDFCSRDEFRERARGSDLIAGHAGAGLVLTSYSVGKKPILLPRLSRLREHIDDHQLDFFNALLQKKQCINGGRLDGYLDAISLINKCRYSMESIDLNLSRAIGESIFSIAKETSE
jgi:UDP-N-acetylglucosamine transferase subunit ALG13